MELRGGSALVVGGAGGFGAATVRRLAAGMNVVIADPAENTGTALADGLGTAIKFIRTEVTSEDSIRTAIAAAAAPGPLRVVVIVHGGPVAQGRIASKAGSPYPVEDFRRTADNDYLNGTVIRIDGAQRF